MIQNLEIQNFKSIKDLKLSCKKVNVFIGEPNAGKTNIIEALASLSEGNDNVNDLIRFKGFAEVFYNKEVSQKAVINIGNLKSTIYYDSNEYKIETAIRLTEPKRYKEIRINSHDSSLISSSHNYQSGEFPSKVRYYQYKSLSNFRFRKPGSLSSPFGENLIACISTNEKARNIIGEIYKQKGLRLLLDEERGEVSVIKDLGNISNRYSFESTSETLRRITFFILALETNENKVIVFDEPEANLFPFYTTYFAERLASDETNQYFFTSHNSYLINTLVAKMGPQNLNICLTYMEDFQTKIKVLSDEDVEEFVNSEFDVTLNFNYFLEHK